MKLSELEKLGLVTLVLPFSEEDGTKEILSEGGKTISSLWMELEDEDKEEIMKRAHKGIENLFELWEEHYK